MRLLGVGKRYGTGPWVLSDVDLDLSAGEVVAVLGGNGAGKSTLLRLLVGLSRPTVGELRDRPTPTGYVPDRFPTHDRMSARAYLTHMGRLRGLRTRPATTRAGELLDRLSLAGGADTPIRRLSRGNAQKVALAQALLVPPALLVLDEPWSGLDVSAHGVLAEIIGEIGAAGGRVVFTDHRAAVAAAHATRHYRINAGRLTEEHEPRGALVELAPTVQRPVDLTGEPGVLGTTTRQDTLTILVADNHRDALLRTALAGGWSVLGVHRNTTGHDTPPGDDAQRDESRTDEVQPSSIRPDEPESGETGMRSVGALPT